MIKKPIIIFTLLLSASSFAFGDCHFPQHFKINGPSGSHILDVHASSDATLRAIQTSITEFDVIDEAHCDGKGINTVVLKFGMDNQHFSEITFVDNYFGSILVVRSLEIGKFHLDGIRAFGKSEFQLYYVMS